MSEIRDKVFDYQEFIETFAKRPTVDQLFEGISTQVAAGFALTGAGLGLILAVHSTWAVLATVAVIALGNAFLSPNLAAMVSRRGAAATGAVLGTQSATGSFGQLGGTLAGAALFSWNVALPFALSGTLLLALGAALAWGTLRATATNAR